MMVVEIPTWTAHYNQLLYSLLMYSDAKNMAFKIVQNSQVPMNCAVLLFDGKRIFMDYSDDFRFSDDHSKYDCYFKRSLLIGSWPANVYPLNFQVNFAYKPFKLLSKFDRSVLVDTRSKVELIRAIDFWGLFTNDSHNSKLLKSFTEKKNKKNHAGQVIFMTRLWDPARNNDSEEKLRRIAQNNFRIGACRTIKKAFPNAIVGIYPDYFAKEQADDVLLELKYTKKKNYIDLLSGCDIAIADDGLKDTPGWKIGEYIISNKAIITTPINIITENFIEGTHYLSTKGRENFEILPELIENLLTNDNFRQFQNANKDWYVKHLEPIAYVENILGKMRSH